MITTTAAFRGLVSRHFSCLDSTEWPTGVYLPTEFSIIMRVMAGIQPSHDILQVSLPKVSSHLIASIGITLILALLPRAGVFGADFQDNTVLLLHQVYIIDVR